MTKSGQVEYNFYEGHFLRALSQAYKNILKVYNKQGDRIDGVEIENVILVIDEINRGNSSSIFGSVFQLLDRDNEGWSNYNTNINGVMFFKLLELIGFTFSYDKNQEIDEYKLKPYDGVKKLETLQEKIPFLNFDLVNKTIRIPPNLSIVATMNTSDSSIYYMDTAFKRRWDWEFIDVNSEIIKAKGIAFHNREVWNLFIRKLNNFIKSNHKSIRGIEDKQVGNYFIQEDEITNADIQSKLMFFIWDSVFSRDKRPLKELLNLGDDDLITFGDFSYHVEKFIEAINSRNV
jgi:5-methylcytosine-specific restriction endonuclease McrBC GTP-binding regulatory subunit McrB